MGTASHVFTEQNLRSLPAPIVDKLRSLISRVKRIALLKGICATIAVGLGSLLAIMAIDAAVTLFSSSTRWSLTLSALGLTVLAGWWFVFRPLTKRITLTSIARYVEERHPELQETISSAVQLLTSDDPDEIRGSEELIGEVVKTAVRDVKSVSTKEEFDASPIKKYGTVALSLGGVMALAFLIFPKPAGILLTRAVAPFLEVGNAYADTLTVKPGDITVSAGSDVTVEMSIKHKRLNRATVRRTDEGHRDEGVERMDLIGSDENHVKTFVRTFPNVQESFEYRVHAGSALSQYYKVTVVPPPAVEQISIRYEFPDYTGLNPVEQVSENGEIVALENTRVVVTAKTNRKMDSAVLMIGNEPQMRVLASGDEEIEPTQVQWAFRLKRDQESDWRVQLKDEHGFENESVYYQLRSERDEAPTIAITSPEAEELRLRPTEFVPITFTATEDFGFSATDLLVRIDSRTEEVLPQTFPVRQNGSWGGTATLDLASLKLVERRARTLEVRVKIADNLPPEFKGAQTAVSRPIKIRIEQKAKALVGQIFEAQEREIREKLEKAKAELRQARQENEEAKRRMEREKEVTPEALADLDQSRKKMAEAEGTLSELAAKMDETVFADRAKEMKDIAKSQVKEARETAENIPLTDEQSERNEQAKEVTAKLDEAVKGIDEVLANLQEARKEVEMVAELTELANEQRRLAQEAQDRAEEQAAQAAMDEEPIDRAAQQAEAAERKAQEQWQQEQQRLQRELAQMLRDNPEALQQVVKNQAQRAEDLAEQAEDAAQQQEELREAGQQAQKPEEAALLAEELMRQLQQEQAQIAERADALRESMAKTMPEGEDASQPLNEAAQNAEEAGKELARENLEMAQAEAEQAAENFEEATNQMERQRAQETVQDRAEVALEEAVRQQQGNKPPDPTMQEAIARAAEDFAEHMANQPQSDTSQREFEEQMKQAAREMAQAQQADAEAGAEEIAKPAEEQFQAQAEEAMQEMAKEALAEALGEKGEPQSVAQREAVEQAAESVAEQLAGEPMSSEDFSEAMQAAADAMAEASAEEGEESAEQLAEAVQEALAQAAQEAQARGQSAENAQQARAEAEAEQKAGEPESAIAQAAQEAIEELARIQALTELSELEDRQENVAEALDALQNGQLEEALAEMQESLAQEAAELAQQAEALEEEAQLAQQSQAQSAANRAESLLENAQRQSEAAGQRLEQAQAAQDQSQAKAAQAEAQESGESMSAEEAMAQAQTGDLPPTQPSSTERSALSQSQASQRNAQQAFQEAAQQLSRAAEALEQKSEQLAPTQQPGEEESQPMVNSEELAQSFEQTSQAAQAETAAQAAQQAQQAAQSLQQMAQQALQNMGAIPQNSPLAQSQPGEPGEASPEAQSSNPLERTAKAADADASGVPPELAELGISAKDWARLKGTLKNGVTSEGKSGAPAEYQPLVSEYFRRIAAEARKQ